jgi:hypothetical protein
MPEVYKIDLGSIQQVSSLQINVKSSIVVTDILYDREPREGWYPQIIVDLPKMITPASGHIAFGSYIVARYIDLLGSDFGEISSVQVNIPEVGESAAVVPAGGLIGQALMKTSDEDYAVAWGNLEDSLLVKPADSDFVAAGTEVEILSAPEFPLQLLDLHFRCTGSTNPRPDGDNVRYAVHLRRISDNQLLYLIDWPFSMGYYHGGTFIDQRVSSSYRAENRTYNTANPIKYFVDQSHQFNAFHIDSAMKLSLLVRDQIQQPSSSTDTFKFTEMAFFFSRLVAT